MTSTRSPRAQGALAVITLAITLGFVAGGGSAQAAAPASPTSPCGHYALVLQHVASVDVYDRNRDGWHCSGPLAPRPGGSDPVLYADNTRLARATGATKYFATGGSGFRALLSTSPRQDRYTARVSVEDGDGPFDMTFRYDSNDRFYLNYGDGSAAGGSRLVTLQTFEQALAAAAASPYFHRLSLDALYSPSTGRSSIFSLYAAPDESPAINDVATLRSGAVTPRGNISVSLNLTCPKGDRFAASMTTLTVGSGAPDDIFSSNGGSPTTGTCTGIRQTIKLLLITAPIDGVLYPAPRNCSAEYGVTIDGPARADGSPRWTVAFDRGGADGGPDGPGPALCLT